jgi:hypothetical protein
MIPVQHVMPNALASVLRLAPLTPEKVAFAWRTAVGAAVDRATGVELRESTLVVMVKSDEWRHEITRSLGLIRSRLNFVLGDGVVARIELQSDAPRDERAR